MSCFSITISAPHPSYAQTIVLPRPKLNDPLKSQTQIVKHVSVGGVIRTYVKPALYDFLGLEFDLSEEKMYELQQFVATYHASKLRLSLPYRLRSEYVGYLQNNPFQTTHLRRSGTISLDFEVQQL